jgi:phenylalanyl-tRNA synthetase beta chain
LENLLFSDVQRSFTPYRSAELYLPDNSILGTFGQINPILANRLNISAELYLFEFNVELIKQQIQVNKCHFIKNIHHIQKIIKDLSLLSNRIYRSTNYKRHYIVMVPNFLSINLLDEYRGSSIPESHTSLCLQLIFQSDKKTLENKQIDHIISGLQLLLTEEFGALIRE